MMKNLLSVLLIFSMSVVTDETKDIAYIYSYDNTNQIVMNICLLYTSDAADN